MIKRWYRGHEGDVDALENFGVIWLTNSPIQAEFYGELYDTGVVSAIDIDMDKLILPKKLYNGFDVWEPGQEEFRYLEKTGCNAYIFNIDNIKCLGLLTKEAVVNVTIYKDIYNTFINENRLKNIVQEAIKKVLKTTLN